MPLRVLVHYILLFIVMAGVAVSFSARGASLEGLDVSSSEGATRLVFSLDSETTSKVFTLDNPARLVVDLDETQRSGPLTTGNADSALVKSVRSGVRQGRNLRIVLDLTAPVSFTQQWRAGSGGRDLVIDLRGSGSGAAPSTGGDPIEAIIRQRENAATEALARRKVQEDAQEDAAEQAAVPARQPATSHPRRDIVVVVDPGHGGKDPGAVGPHRVYEKNVVLQMARRLAARFNATPGFKAYLTRNSDVFIPLRGRTDIARNHHADFFVSIHADAARSSSPRGSSVFALSQHGATSESARWLAKSENDSDLIGGVGGDLSLGDKDRMLRGVLLDLSMTATINDSLGAGSDVLRQIKRVNKIRHGRVEQAGFVVLKSPDIPSLLIETGFITNQTEERLLQSPSHQTQLMNAVYSGIKAHFERQPPPDSLIAWQRDQSRGGARDEYRVRSGDTLSSIASRYNVSLVALRQANQLSSSVLRVGQVLNIP
ncbi:N-acetylmuramoyl-L-alanine amidase [Larsenimonas rhizosphaerae]|uniref:N-acetylmuramoyl-L-alanine amidase AmiC n=1 Tax=Larsenimonas rhizosphaerae TaxID=2944682 RepID=A0AA42CV59_9GAMM|nr:N-acetylmuramoyl-L-alanine amidase [Larsenimonas rhizosphaerae]MCM2132088.1 N-acetylmuramoyl-L-alanine amidase [Larsenimonas rhizosphaerae]MCX2524691.1 N-acetylmuramoyl-L-alanine amidase [Larsenimonas rhizosphaerae]